MSLNSANHCFIGLDIGGTNIKFIAVDRHLKTLHRGSRPSQADISYEHVIAVAAGILAELDKLGFTASQVGVGCAGSVDRQNGVVRTSPNFLAWRDVPLADLLTGASGTTCIVENDANCAAWGEWMVIAPKGPRSLLAVTLGTGIGGGLIVDGRIFRGATSTAPEIGHMTLDFRGNKCGCGNVGCFELYCSGTAILRETGLSAREFFDRVSKSAPLLKFLDEYILRLSVGLASLANILDPDMICLAGGVAQGIEAPVLQQISQNVKAFCFPSIAQNIRIELGKLDEFSGAFGAALLSQERA